MHEQHAKHLSYLIWGGAKCTVYAGDAKQNSELDRAEVPVMKRVPLSIRVWKKWMQMLVLKYSPYPKTLFFKKDSPLAPISILGLVYNIFVFEPHHNLHLGISELLKECTVKFLGLNKVETELGVVVEQKHPLSPMRVFILRRINSLLSATDPEAAIPVLRAYFSCKDRAMQSNGVFRNIGMRGMLEKNDYRAVDIVFSIIKDYIVRATGFQNDANILYVHHMYANTVSKVVSQNSNQGRLVAKLGQLVGYVFALLHKVVSMFLSVYTCGLITLMFHF